MSKRRKVIEESVWHGFREETLEFGTGFFYLQVLNFIIWELIIILYLSIFLINVRNEKILSCAKLNGIFLVAENDSSVRAQTFVDKNYSLDVEL